MRSEGARIPPSAMFPGTFLHGPNTGPDRARAWEEGDLGRVEFRCSPHVKWRHPASTMRQVICVEVTVDVMGVRAEIPEAGHVETRRG